MDFDQAIKDLARAQEDERLIKQMYAKPLMEMAVFHNKSKILEENIRAAALMDFMDGGEKPNHEAIDIKQMTQRNYNTPENLNNAFMSHPEFLIVRDDLFAAHALDIVEAIHAIRTAQSLGDEGNASEWATILVKHLMHVFIVNEKALKTAVDEGNAPWANFTETKKPTVFLSSKLGQWLE